MQCGKDGQMSTSEALEKSTISNILESCSLWPLAVGDMVIIKSEEKNRDKWPLRIVKELYPGRDGVVRAVKVRSGRNFLERLVQHLYPLELSSESVVRAPFRVLNADALVFRPRRQAALQTDRRICQIAEVEQNLV